MKDLSLIVAMTRNRVIGINNQLPWHLPEDLKYFKEVTMGSPMIMGRKTFESIGRLLPGRLNIIVTRNRNYSPEEFLKSKGIDLTPEKRALALVTNSLEEAIEASHANNQQSQNSKTPFLIGGAELFQQGIDLCTKLYITWIDKDFAGDAFFPELSLDQYSQTQCLEKTSPYPHSYCVYSRI